MGTSYRPDNPFAPRRGRYSADNPFATGEGDAFADVESGSSSGATRRPQTMGQKAVGAVAQVGQNWGDEIAGGMAAVKSFMGSGSPTKALGAYRTVQGAVESAADQFADEHPKTAVGIGVGSALVPVGGAAVTAARWATAGKLGRAAMSAPVIGAATGALTGAGRGNSAEERATNAAVGGGIGAVAGTVLSPLARALANSRPGQALVRRGGNTLTKLRTGKAPVAGPVSDPMRDKTLDVVAKAFARDGVPLADAEQAMAAFQQGDPELLFNVGGENVKALMRTIQSIPGKGKETVQSALERQAPGVPEVVGKGVEKALGKKIPNFDSRVVELADEAADAARPHYEALRNEFVQPSDALKKIVGRPSVAEAIDDAKRNLLDAGEGVPDGFTVGLLDDAKKVLDARIESIEDKIAKGMATGKEKSSLRAVTSAREALVSHVDDMTGGRYAQAREVAGEGIRKREAFRGGKGALSARADDLEVRGLSPEERALQLEGAATDIQERLTSKNPTNAASVFDPKAQRNLDIMTEGTPAQQILRDAAKRTRKLNDDARAATMRGQSTTASTTAGQQELADEAEGTLVKSAGGVGKLLTGQWRPLARDAIEWARRRAISGKRGAIADAAADMLTTRAGDPALQSIFRDLIAREMRRTAHHTGARVAGAAAGGAVGGRDYR